MPSPVLTSINKWKKSPCKRHKRIDPALFIQSQRYTSPSSSSQNTHLQISADHNFLKRFFPPELLFPLPVETIQTWNTVRTYPSHLKNLIIIAAFPISSITSFERSLWNQKISQLHPSKYSFELSLSHHFLAHHSHLIDPCSIFRTYQNFHFIPFLCKHTSQRTWLVHPFHIHRIFNSWNSISLILAAN